MPRNRPPSSEHTEVATRAGLTLIREYGADPARAVQCLVELLARPRGAKAESEMQPAVADEKEAPIAKPS